MFDISWDRISEWVDDEENWRMCKLIIVTTVIATTLIYALAAGTVSMISGMNKKKSEATLHINYRPESVAKPPAPVTPVYVPPCAKDARSGCGDRVYGKRLLEGIVDTVTFHSSESALSTGNDQHLQPDFTEVTLAPADDQAQELTEKFCGNVLDQFNPGQSVKRIIKESVLSDYNGCYIIRPVEITFGGKHANSWFQSSKVPGVYMTPGDIKALKDCEHGDGGTCGL